MPAKILWFVSRGMQSYIKWKMSCYHARAVENGCRTRGELTARIERDTLRFPRPRSESQRADDDDDMS